jgi:4-hydroxybenzoyl-CoA reductase subunit alpha
MGIGQAMSEENHYDKDTGLPVGPNMLDYRVPSAIESPDIEVRIVESMDPNGPFGAKEASEGALAAVIPALANAIHDATGLRLHETPLTPDRIIDAMVRKEREDRRTKNSKGAA